MLNKLCTAYCRLLNNVQQLLPLKYTAEINGVTWKGEAIIPWNYFPPDVKRFNAYAIHGTTPRRIYEALYPVPRGSFREPDLWVFFFFSLSLSSVSVISGVGLLPADGFLLFICARLRGVSSWSESCSLLMHVFGCAYCKREVILQIVENNFCDVRSLRITNSWQLR